MAPAQTKSPPSWTFINIPYDAEYEPLFLAFIAGSAAFGFIPHATLEIPPNKTLNAGTLRLTRILDLIKTCKVSFHDLCRVELDNSPPPTPRFNMPFELGLAVAIAELSDNQHQFFMFESMANRVLKSLSDMNGLQVFIHENTPEGVLQGMLAIFETPNGHPSYDELLNVYEDLKEASVKLKGGFKSLYHPNVFSRLRIAATSAVENRIPSHATDLEGIKQTRDAIRAPQPLSAAGALEAKGHAVTPKTTVIKPRQ